MISGAIGVDPNHPSGLSGDAHLDPSIGDLEEFASNAAQRPDSFVPYDRDYLASLVAGIQTQLEAYGGQHNLRGLQRRISIGLDPASMLAVGSLHPIIERVANGLHADMSAVNDVTHRLHVGAMWEMADALRETTRPEIMVWMILANACAPEGGELSPEDFLKDYLRVRNILTQASADPAGFAEAAKQNLVRGASDRVRIVDGVPIGVPESDAHLSMAVLGYTAGIAEMGGLYFVGARELDYSVLERLGLERRTVVDRSTRQLDVYGRPGFTYDPATDADAVVKALGGGFALVFGGAQNLEIAKALARTGLNETPPRDSTHRASGTGGRRHRQSARAPVLRNRGRTLRTGSCASRRSLQRL